MRRSQVRFCFVVSWWGFVFQGQRSSYSRESVELDCNGFAKVFLALCKPKSRKTCS